MKKLLSLVCLSISTSFAADAPPPSPEQGGPRDWVVSSTAKYVKLYAEASDKSEVMGTVKNKTVLDNLNGCMAAKSGDIWCDVQPMGGGKRGYIAYKNIKPAVSPNGSVAKGPDDSALRAGEKKYDATGNVPCAENVGQPTAQCEFGVARAGGGYATVVVKRPSGKTRTIYFRMGKPISADGSEADGYPSMKAKKQSDLNIITVGKERYEIPDAVVMGG